MKNHFEFYEIEERFFIDEQKLKQHFLKLSKEHHPDFFINDEEKYDKALELTSQNNAAYKAIKTFSGRVQYILKQNGLLEEQGSKLPPDFLMEMMDVNEEIMDLKMEFDSEKLKSLTTRVTAMAEAWNGKVLQLAKEADAITNENRVDILKKVKEFYLKQKYVLRLKESLNTFAPL